MLFTMFVLFLFGWLFFHSIGLALHLTWCAAKVIAALLFAVALPVLLVCLFIGSVHVVTSTWAFKTSALKLPKGAVYMCAPIGFGYMTLQTVARMVNIAKATDDELNHKEAE